jgi:uncharacterized protein
MLTRPVTARPHDAACLYDGHVMHARLRPIAHRFRYRVFSLLIDLDRLDEADGLSRLFSVNRGNLVSFHEGDHGRRDGTPLAGQARELARQAGIADEIGRVTLLCYPRIFGYVFNPLSVYYLYDCAEALRCILYEVRNTFSEWHTYVAPIEPGQFDRAGLRQSRDKLFYVSPFIEMASRYDFYLTPPADSLFLRVANLDTDGRLLTATFAGLRRPLSSRQLATICIAIPAMTLKIVAGIHWEALKLWLKGVRLVRRPPPPPATSFGAAGSFGAGDRNMAPQDTSHTALD